MALTNFDMGTQFWPTFLDFAKWYPDQVFTAFICAADRGKFGTRKAGLQGRQVCLPGLIRENRGKPEMILNDPGQLTQ